MLLLVKPPAPRLLRQLPVLALLLRTFLGGSLLLLLVPVHDELVVVLLPAPGRAARPLHRAQPQGPG